MMTDGKTSTLGQIVPWSWFILIGMLSTDDDRATANNARRSEFDPSFLPLKSSLMSKERS